MKTYEEILSLFKTANEEFLAEERLLFDNNVSERTLCGALMLKIHDFIKNNNSYEGYFVDVEYNRNKGNLKTIYITYSGPKNKIIQINCDLILHSRGRNTKQDNLLAIEMKKSNRSKSDKISDKERLKALTKDSFDDIWSNDGQTLPEHVCGYVLGIYYEINYKKREILLEYYIKGKIVAKGTRSF